MSFIHLNDMKIKSLIREEKISIKDVLLKKYTGKSITSESYMKIPSQPKNTCPIIDKAIESNNEIISKLSTRESDGKSNLRVRVIEDECESNCEECLKNNIINIEMFNSSLQDAQSYLAQINDYLEILRKNCENLRLYGHDLKDLIWKFYEEEIVDKDSYNLLKSKKPKDEINSIFLEKIFNKIDLSVPKFENAWCKFRCYNNRENDLLESHFDNMNVDINYSEHIEYAFNNLYIIDEWVSCIESFIEKLEEKDLEEIGDLELNKYVELYNANQKELFLTEFKKTETINLINLDNELKEYLKNTENLIVFKKIKDIEFEANYLLREFKNLIKTDNYNTLCKEYSIFFEKLHNFKEEIDKNLFFENVPLPLSPNDLKKMVEINQILVPLRTPINFLYSSLLKNGPQEFNSV